MMDDGMSYAHISVDLQLYMVASKIKWNDIDRFKNVILRPGIMHTAQSFCGCISKLICGSGFEHLISSAFGGLTNRNHERQLRQVMGSGHASVQGGFDYSS